MSERAPVQTILRMSPDSVPPDSNCVPVRGVITFDGCLVIMEERGGVKGVPINREIRNTKNEIRNRAVLILAKVNWRERRYQ